MRKAMVNHRRKVKTMQEQSRKEFLNEELVNKLVDESEDKIFSVHFIKKDGSLRKMVCRRSVSKGVKGVGRKFDPEQYHLKGVYDMQKQGHRMFSTNKVKQMKVKGKVYSI